ncbi:sterol-binding protein [Thecaphora frezii]|nr:PRY1-like protein [Thecaphora frezii]
MRYLSLSFLCLAILLPSVANALLLPAEVSHPSSAEPTAAGTLEARATPRAKKTKKTKKPRPTPRPLPTPAPARAKGRVKTTTLTRTVTRGNTVTVITVTRPITIAQPTPSREIQASTPTPMPNNGIAVGEPNPATPYPGKLNDGDVQAVLDAHNSDRAIHRVAPLRWSSTLAQYASTQASKCRFVHSAGPYGENLAVASPSLDVAYAIRMWYDEISQYDFRKPGFSATTAHFSQVIWQGTKEVGCVKVACPMSQVNDDPGLQGTGEMVWCVYDPAGNVIDGFKENVYPPANYRMV